VSFVAAHLIRNPKGTFSVVGSVPETCLETHTPPSRDEVMAGRVFKRDGAWCGWSGRVFATREAAGIAVLDGGGLCCTCCAWREVTP